MRERVLIVDDHAVFRSWARVFLEAEGYDIVGEAEDGATRRWPVRRPSSDPYHHQDVNATGGGTVNGRRG
jgi:DNA-binding NarL/FixJ family response regulator